jgi:threonylcarbamoyladenosine tRNA methylthiotransferase MtaB
MMKRVAAATIGCKVNAYDTQAVLTEFRQQGYEVVDFRDAADIYVINTCCVTNLADKKSRQMVGRALNKAKERNSGAIVVVMGCASQGNPLTYRDLGADIVIGTTGRNEILTHIANFESKPTVDINENVLSENTYEASKTGFADDRTRAFLKVQEGCSNFCAYCIIPHMRGPSRSRNFADVLAEAAAMTCAGFKEIVVAGIHVASYGKDLDGANRCDLVDLLAEIVKLPGLWRLRLSSIEPMAINAKFCDFVVKNSKFCDHLHLSLQSGSDNILNSMNRKYDRQLYRQAVEMLRKALPQVNITTDIIVGFPGETEDDHKQTLEFVQGLGLSKLHVFPFAPKKGTAAARLENQVSKALKNRRAKEMLDLGARLEKEYYGKFISQTMPVLVEKEGADGLFHGKTTNYIAVAFKANGKNGDLINEIVDVKMAELRDNKLIGAAKM